MQAESAKWNNAHGQLEASAEEASTGASVTESSAAAGRGDNSSSSKVELMSAIDNFAKSIEPLVRIIVSSFKDDELDSINRRKTAIDDIVAQGQCLARNCLQSERVQKLFVRYLNLMEQYCQESNQVKFQDALKKLVVIVKRSKSIL